MTLNRITSTNTLALATAFTLAGATLFLVGCGSGDPKDQFPPVPESTGERLISSDALRVLQAYETLENAADRPRTLEQIKQDPSVLDDLIRKGSNTNSWSFRGENRWVIVLPVLMVDASQELLQELVFQEMARIDSAVVGIAAQQKLAEEGIDIILGGECKRLFDAADGGVWYQWPGEEVLKNENQLVCKELWAFSPSGELLTYRRAAQQGQ